MNARKVEDLLNKMELIAAQVEGQDATLASYTGSLRNAVKELRAELFPPPEANVPKTRDQISSREWAEYEWHDVTSMGDRQRKYLRGLKR